MPSPNKGERQEDFISRCLSSDESNKTFPEQSQRAAFCYSQWRNKDKNKEAAAFAELIFILCHEKTKVS